MRICGGALARRHIHAPPGLSTRPTADKVRQALFHILGPPVPGAAVLDLFAGTGALGIEALSRGAGRAVFIDEDPGALAALRRNLRDLGLQDQAEVRAEDVFRGLGRLERAAAPFHWIFADPPYRDAALLVPRLLRRLGEGALVAPEGVVVVESATHPREAVPVVERYGRLVLQDQRSYGQTGLLFYGTIEPPTLTREAADDDDDE